MAKQLILLSCYLNLAEGPDGLSAFRNKQIHLQKIVQSIYSNSNLDIHIFTFTTKGEERLECVYPKLVVSADIAKEFESTINQFIDAVKKTEVSDGK